MSVGSMKVSLRRGDATLMSLQLERGCEPVLVGRSRECTLKVPSDEHSVSGKHARLFWQGSKLFVEDAGSTNGVFHDGVQLVKPLRVRYGDRFALGNCQLVVAAKSKGGKSTFSRYHRLEYMNGDAQGRMVDICPRDGGDEFVIGLDPGSDICLADMLVSRKHALLRVKENGECWIEDQESRNGTYVNGDKLVGKPRLLKHGDRIAIAYFDFRFLDRNVRVTRVQVWKRLAVLAVTVCAVAAAYVLWMLPRPGPDAYLDTARQYAAKADFALARAAIASARSTRDASKFIHQVDSFEAQLELWERTKKDWESLCGSIASGQMATARKTMDQMAARPIEAWAWDPEGMAALRREAEFVMKALRLYFDGREAIDSTGAGSRAGMDKKVRSVSEPVDAFLKSQAKTAAGLAYLKPLVRKLETLLADLSVIRQGLDVVDTGIRSVSMDEPDFQPVLTQVQHIAEDAKYPAAVREYARFQIAPCQAFLEAQKFIAQEVEALLEMDFTTVAGMEKTLKLPDQEMCTRQTKYSDVRAAFAKRHEKIQKEASAVGMIVDGLKASGITMENGGATLASFAASGNWKKALAFDCLLKGPPSPRRTEPSSVYDEMLGIEFTYEGLRAMPNVSSGPGTRMVGFVPKCVMMRKAFEKAETFVQYLDAVDHKYLQQGKLGRFYAVCVKIAITREEMVVYLKGVQGSKRQKLVASFYAEYFTARPSFAAKRAIESSFNALRREVSELGDQYAGESDPEKQIRLRKRIMELALPGDPVLHNRWVEAFN